MEVELHIRDCEVPLLKCCLERLLQLFECLAQVEEFQDHIQLRLWTHKEDDTLQNAQDYLLSVTSQNPPYEKSLALPSERLAQLFSSRGIIERDARVLLRFTESDLVLRGPKSNVEFAMQLVDDFLAHGVGEALKHSYTADSLLSDPVGMTGRRLTCRVESEDSSYDSDTESGLGPCSKSQGSTNQQKAHNDVSRTVSDTLGAEFAEYVSTHKVELQTVLADPSYQTRLEFAVKLGYTETQVQNALQRLGLNTSNNELLAELIKLSSAANADIPEAAAAETRTQLRPIVIDGSNVAMSHGNKDTFSCRGIKICVDWFRSRGHKEVTVFVPSWRKEAARPNTPISNQEILLQMERDQTVVFTPSRNVGGKRLVCYEDRYILKLAVETDGVIVSNDNYRDLVNENPDYKKAVEERLLMYTFVNDRFMPPDDPLGRTGPTLDLFLKKECAIVTPPMPPVCPYAKKCTYGNKCKYYHPERGNMPQKSITERLAEQAKIQLQEAKARGNIGNELTRTRSVPVTTAGDLSAIGGAKKKLPLSRTRSAAPSQRPQDEFAPHSGFSGDALWRHQSWSNLPKTMLSESGHLSLAKKLSDPDSHCMERAGDQGGNLHKKLQRQLTLNPNNDERLAQMKLVNTQGRNASSHNVATINSDGYAHASQNDAYTDGWQAGVLSGQNSTSDTKLNMFPNQFVPPTCYQANIWSPILSHQNVRPSSVPPQNRMRAPLMLPQQNSPFGSSNIPPSMSPYDERIKLFFHLTSIFPEEQVKVAMDLQPDELNAQKICAAIISMFPTKP